MYLLNGVGHRVREGPAVSNACHAAIANDIKSRTHSACGAQWYRISNSLTQDQCASMVQFINTGHNVVSAAAAVAAAVNIPIGVWLNFL